MLVGRKIGPRQIAKPDRTGFHVSINNDHTHTHTNESQTKHVVSLRRISDIRALCFSSIVSDFPKLRIQ